MALFENFPYTNFHELNLDWIIKKVANINNLKNISVTVEMIDPAEEPSAHTTQTDDGWIIELKLPLTGMEGSVTMVDADQPASVSFTQTEHGWDMDLEIPQEHVDSISDSHKIKLIACAIRYNSNTSEWEFIDDSGHTPINVDSITTYDFSHFRLNYSFSGSTVGTLIMTPDESFANCGVFTGASVGSEYSECWLYAANRYGSLINVVNGVAGHQNVPGEYVAMWNPDTTTLAEVRSTAGGLYYVRVEHPIIQGIPILIPLDNINWFIAGMDSNYVNIVPFDANGNIDIDSSFNHRVIVTATGSPRPLTLDQVPATLLATSNVWIYGFMLVDE